MGVGENGREGDNGESEEMGDRGHKRIETEGREIEEGRKGAKREGGASAP